MEDDKAKTALCVGGNMEELDNLFECNRMPFRLTNAPTTFQQLMEAQTGHLPFCQVYLDDIIFSVTFEQQLEATFKSLRDSGLKLKPSKCKLFHTRVKYLGHIISSKGIETDPDKIQVIQDWPLPITVQ